MDLDQTPDRDSSHSDSAYAPQIINEQDAPMTGQEEQAQQYQQPYHNGTSHDPSTTSPPIQQQQQPQQYQQEQQDSRYNSPSMYQQPNSRPGSGMGYAQQQQQYQQPPPQSQQNKSSVVIKVGMVGDAQIGKTSLMVKYVEGSWDEDYIQTLGMQNQDDL